MADGTLLEPLVIAQWVVAIAVVVTVLALRRRGVSIWHGRAGASFWIVVALMHGIVALPGGPGFVGVLDSTPATAAIPAGVGLVAGTLALLLGTAAPRPKPTLGVFRLCSAVAALLPPDLPPRSLAPRAPPA